MDIFMPFTAVFDFLKIPITIGGYTFSMWQFYIAILTMTIVIKAVWSLLDG